MKLLKETFINNLFVFFGYLSGVVFTRFIVLMDTLKDENWAAFLLYHFLVLNAIFWSIVLFKVLTRK